MFAVSLVSGASKVVKWKKKTETKKKGGGRNKKLRVRVRKSTIAYGFGVKGGGGNVDRPLFTPLQFLWLCCFSKSRRGTILSLPLPVRLNVGDRLKERWDMGRLWKLRKEFPV